MPVGITNVPSRRTVKARKPPTLKLAAVLAERGFGDMPTTWHIGRPRVIRPPVIKENGPAKEAKGEKNGPKPAEKAEAPKA